MDNASHAGGIVFRSAGNDVEFLLVRALSNPDHWVLPKGHIEIGEAAEHAARREVAEEAGVSATSLGEVGSAEYSVGPVSIRVRYYLMRYDGELGGGEDRERRWCGFSDALERLSFDDARTALKQAEALRRKT